MSGWNDQYERTWTYEPADLFDMSRERQGPGWTSSIGDGSAIGRSLVAARSTRWGRASIFGVGGLGCFARSGMSVGFSVVALLVLTISRQVARLEVRRQERPVRAGVLEDGRVHVALSGHTVDDASVSRLSDECGVGGVSCRRPFSVLSLKA